MIKRSWFVLGVSAMLAMPFVANGQTTPSTPGTGSGPGAGGSGYGTHMEQTERHRTDVNQGNVRQAQERLKEAGFNPGPTDGLLGGQTKEAIKQYQKAHGLPQTGQLDEPTRELLMVQRPMDVPERTRTPSGSMREDTRPGEASPGARTPGAPGSGSTLPGGSSSSR